MTNHAVARSTNADRLKFEWCPELFTSYESTKSMSATTAWMSFWDRYLAPGDIRARQRVNPPQQSNKTEQSAENVPLRTDAGTRQRRQDALLYGGIAFTCLSLLVTRRTLLRKHGTYPKTFTPSNAPPPQVSGGLDAAEALGLATLNVCSFAMIVAGGLIKYFDIGDLEDMREQVRRGIGFDVYGGDSEADKEMEAWVADVLSRKDGEGGIKESIAQKLKDLEEIDKMSKDKSTPKIEQKPAISSWFSGVSVGWTGSFDPKESSNPYINGARKYQYRPEYPLCTRCGQAGHSSPHCGYSALTPEEQGYLRKMVSAQECT